MRKLCANVFFFPPDFSLYLFINSNSHLTNCIVPDLVYNVKKKKNWHETSNKKKRTQMKLHDEMCKEQKQNGNSKNNTKRAKWERAGEREKKPASALSNFIAMLKSAWFLSLCLSKS